MNGWRSNLILTVRTLASEAEQVAYSKKSGLPLADVPGELVCMWGDDLYRPEQPGWSQHFSPSELAAMTEFDRVFESEVNRYEERAAWGRIMAAASELVERVGWGTTASAA